MFAKVVILCAALVAVNAAGLLHGAVLAHTGKSVTSRHQDAFGNYAFGYDIADGHASTKSRSEVGDGHGNKHGTYSSHINHVAPAHVSVAHAAPLAYAAPLAVAHAAPVAYSTSSVVKHVVPAPVLGHYAAAPLAVAHAAPVAYSTSSAVNHVAAVPVAGHLAAAPLVAGHGLVGAGHLSYANGIAGHGLVGAGHLAYANGIAGHGLVGSHFGGIAYGGVKSIHY